MPRSSRRRPSKPRGRHAHFQRKISPISFVRALAADLFAAASRRSLAAIPVRPEQATSPDETAKKARQILP